MTDLVPTDQIERIVGARRHPHQHLGRAVSAEQTVYILHSEKCRDSGTDLRECATALSQEFAAVVREAFLEVATGGWKAHAIGMPEDKMLVLLADTMEPLVQSIVRQATR